MKLSEAGARIAVVGASSLLGKELLSLLEESPFPVSRIITVEDESGDPGLPILDLREGSHEGVGEAGIHPDELDLIFVSSLSKRAPKFLGPRVAEGALAGSERARPAVIDLTGGLSSAGNELLRVPFLERGRVSSAISPPLQEARLIASPHSAAIVLSALLLRTARRFQIESAVAQVFAPASELGPLAIEELQNQAVSLLGFKEIPQAIFGGQLAFNLLPRFSGERAGVMELLEHRVRKELERYFRGRAVLPALRVFPAPIFYSLALSLYLEMREPCDPQALASALAGKPVEVRKPSGRSPSSMDAAGTDGILVDTVTADPSRPTGLWIWATADNLRLAARNAIAIAEDLS